LRVSDIVYKDAALVFFKLYFTGIDQETPLVYFGVVTVEGGSFQRVNSESTQLFFL